MRKHGLSIRMQLFLALLSTTVIITATFGLVVVDRFQARTFRFAHRAAEDDAQILSNVTGRFLQARGLSLPAGSFALAATHALDGFTAGREGARVQLLDTGGAVLFDSAGPTGENLGDRPEVRVVLAGGTDQGPGRLGKTSMVVAAAPIIVEGRRVGAARVLKSAFGVSEIMADIAPKVALLGLILAGAAAAAGAIIGRNVAAPLERLTEAAERIAAGQRQAALPVPRGREVRALTKAFEDMRRELEQRLGIERMAADLSHEVKNPVASIHAAAEVLEDAIGNDPQAARNFARRIGEAAGRLDSLVRDFLSLSQLEARGLVKNPLDLCELVRSAVDALEPQARARKVTIATELPSSAKLAGDASWLRRAVENLLANAVRFAPPDSTVTVTLVPLPRGYELLVADQGRGVDPALKERIFERFVTTRHEEGGSGLGLAIVRAVAEGHGGRAELRSTGPSGSTFALFLPGA